MNWCQGALIFAASWECRDEKWRKSLWNSQSAAKLFWKQSNTKYAVPLLCCSLRSMSSTHHLSAFRFITHFNSTLTWLVIWLLASLIWLLISLLNEYLNEVNLTSGIPHLTFDPIVKWILKWVHLTLDPIVKRILKRVKFYFWHLSSDFWSYC